MTDEFEEAQFRAYHKELESMNQEPNTTVPADLRVVHTFTIVQSNLVLETLRKSLPMEHSEVIVNQMREDMTRAVRQHQQPQMGVVGPAQAELAFGGDSEGGDV